MANDAMLFVQGLARWLKNISACFNHSSHVIISISHGSFIDELQVLWMSVVIQLKLAV
jgi:hypothetical protein